MTNLSSLITTRDFTKTCPFISYIEMIPMKVLDSVSGSGVLRELEKVALLENRMTRKTLISNPSLNGGMDTLDNPSLS